MSPRFHEPRPQATESAAMPYDPEHDQGTDSVAAAIVRRHEGELLAVDGVEGVAVGRSSAGEDVAVVYCRDESVRGRVPTAIEGLAVRIVVTGGIEAL